MSEDLSDLAWALLRMLHRCAQGGPKPPTGYPFTDVYRELETQGLAADGQLTKRGELVLYKRYGNSSVDTLASPTTGRAPFK